MVLYCMYLRSESCLSTTGSTRTARCTCRSGGVTLRSAGTRAWQTPGYHIIQKKKRHSVTERGEERYRSTSTNRYNQISFVAVRRSITQKKRKQRSARWQEGIWSGVDSTSQRQIIRWSFLSQHSAVRRRRHQQANEKETKEKRPWLGLGRA